MNGLRALDEKLSHICFASLAETMRPALMAGLTLGVTKIFGFMRQLRGSLIALAGGCSVLSDIFV